jgi:hypothetical protein
MSDKGVTVEDLEDIDQIIGTEKPTKTKTTKKRSSGGTSGLSRRLKKMITLLGAVVEPMDSFDGQILKDNAGEIADALADLANESDRVRRFLEGSLEGGAWTAVGLLVGGKVVLPVAVHHGMLPDTVNDQLAATMDIPVRRKKRRPASVSFIVPEEADQIDGEDDEPVQYGRVRHPDTGEMVTVPLDPATNRPKVDGDGRPIVDE